uniref:hypothetical protein n=1 Tax=Vibrio cholerae TaxID=666 RepID=UPI003F58179D
MWCDRFYHSKLRNLTVFIVFDGYTIGLFWSSEIRIATTTTEIGRARSGNALVETGTFLAILLGTLGAGLIASADNAHYFAAAAVVIFAVLGYLSSRAIPLAPASAPHLEFRWRPITQTKQTLRIAKRDRAIFQSIMAISWFWFLGAVYLTQFPNFTKLHLNGNEAAVSFLLALFFRRYCRRLTSV